MKKASTSYIATLILFVLFLPNSVTLAEQNESKLAQKIRHCAAIKSPDKRYLCYDLIAEKLDHGRASSIDKNNDNEPKVSSNKALPSTLGGSKFDSTHRESPINTGQVVSCKRASDKRWFFIFENGQVWKQTDRRQRFFKNCQFNVTVQKDGIGYVMSIESKKSKIRIKRTR